MKKILLFVLFAYILFALLPLIAVPEISFSSADDPVSEESQGGEPSRDKRKVTQQETEKQTDTISGDSFGTGFPEDSLFRILDSSTGQVITVDDKDFCRGALAYEMPPGYETEALKAQCIACYTHFSRLREKQKAHPDETLKGADFSADLSHGEFYLSDEALKEKWGDLYEQSKIRLEQAVNDCAGLVLTDENGELIDAAYHAISSGNTENAEDAFGIADKHLISVASPWDKTAPDYYTECSFSEQDFRQRLHDANITSGDELKGEKLTGSIRRTSAGSVEIISFGSQELSGQRARSVFGLRSSCFDLNYRDGRYIFSVRGYGHGVGMSQYGAQCMAKEGSDFSEILHHYYSKCFISASK